MVNGGFSAFLVLWGALWGLVCMGDAGSAGAFPCLLGGGRQGHYLRDSRRVSWITQKKCFYVSLEVVRFRDNNTVYASFGGTAQSPWP